VGSAFKYIEDVSEMYSMCSSLEFVNYNLTFNDLGIESNEIDVFNFDNLKVATNWFNGCKVLKEIKFPSVINFTKLENCSAAFGDCEKLETIFVDSQIKLYDSK
jgi:hypothetical protein